MTDPIKDAIDNSVMRLEQIETMLNATGKASPNAISEIRMVLSAFKSQQQDYIVIPKKDVPEWVLNFCKANTIGSVSYSDTFELAALIAERME